MNETDLGAERSSQTEILKTYLQEFLNDEFRGYANVRLRSMIDGQQDGISLKTESREYFFPYEWADEPGFPQVRKLVAKIKTVLD